MTGQSPSWQIRRRGQQRSAPDEQDEGGVRGGLGRGARE